MPEILRAMLGRSTTTIAPTATLTPTPTPTPSSRRTYRNGARSSSALRAKTQLRDDDDDDDGFGFGGVKMRGRWVSRVTKDSYAYAYATSGWRRTRTHAAANGDAVGESGVAVDGERIVVRARRRNEIRFHFNFIFFEIIDSIRLEESVCRVQLID